MSKINKRVITIPNRRGETLFAILTSPASGTTKKKDIIVFSQVGVVTKTGMGDHLRILSDNLAAEGFTTLRFDQSGTGDSYGELTPGISIAKLFRQVQSGFFQHDMLDIIDWVLGDFSDYRLFLFGECGGCLSSILACAERTDRVSCLMLLAMPVLLYPFDHEQHVGRRGFDAKIIFKSYLDKILSPIAWSRFLSGQSDSRLIRRSLQILLKIYFKKILNHVQLTKREILPDHKRFNWKFWNAFQYIINAEIPIIFLMPELDNETFEFNIEFKEKVLDKAERYSNYCTVTYLPKTDHSIMFQSSREYLGKQLLFWLDKFYQDIGCLKKN